MVDDQAVAPPKFLSGPVDLLGDIDSDGPWKLGHLEPADSIRDFREKNITSIRRLRIGGGAFVRLAILKSCREALRNLLASCLVKEAGIGSADGTDEIGKRRFK